MTPSDDLLRLLSPIFPTHNVKVALKHFQGAVRGFQQGEWETATAKAGKFIEAALKSLSVHARLGVPTGRGFKVDSVITNLERIPRGTVDDAIRLAIPRACRFG